MCFTWLCKPWEGTTVHLVRALRSYVSLGGGTTVHFVCVCFTWLCKPWEATTVHFVCVSRGYICLGGGTTVHFVHVLHDYVSLGVTTVCAKMAKRWMEESQK